MKISVIRVEELAEKMLGNEDQYPEIFTDADEDGDRVIRDDVRGKWFALVWPEHAVTRQHLSDASVQGPYESETEAGAGGVIVPCVLR